MPADTRTQLRNLGDDLRRDSAPITMSEIVGSTGMTASAAVTPIHARRQRETRTTIVRAVALVATAAAVVVGLVLIIDRRDADPVSDQADSAALAAVGSTNAVGLFPAGDLDAVLLAGFGTPQSAVDAYLADRTRPDVLPNGYSATYSVSDTAERVGDNLSLVQFSIATENDSGDGLLLVRQVASVSEPERWVVVSGGIATFTIDQLEYREGRLSGSFSNEMGGQTEIDVFDAASGERVGRSSDNPFVIDNLSSSALSVRFWNTTADGGYPIAVFAEGLVRDGEIVTDIGASALSGTYPTETQPQVEAPSTPFDSGPITAFLPANASNVVTIVDDPQIKIDGSVQRVERTDQDEYCLAINWAGREQDFDTSNGNACFSQDAIGAQQDIGNGAGLGGPVAVLDSLDGTRVLVVGAVPDAVTSIRTDSGESITPIHNIWWDVIDAGTLVTYEIASSDGRTTKLTAG
ncbi:MAG TPA: hypothetical protein VES40_22080 [Ilumatobacteraceae bacterium]|nr:hypothetical protein [Ilumatobacteraceae bacterium]